MPRVVVVGAGISGLAAAWAASRANAGLNVMVLERASDVGGKARSIARDGWLVEGGPSGFIRGRPEMERLIDGAAVRGQVVTARAPAKRRFVLRDGVMREIVPHPVRFLRSGLLTARGAARMLAEPFVPRHRGGEESVWAFAARRLGREFADRLIQPMTLGVFGGDAQRLSVDAAFPRMRGMEREHGSLLAALLKRRGRVGGELTSFQGGMQQLPRALAAAGGFDVRRNAQVSAFTRAGDQWAVWMQGSGEPLMADVVVLAGEPWAMADLLAPHDGTLAAELRAIRCPPVSVVALGYAPGAAVRVPEGFGVLVARGAGYRMLGNLWDTHIFPERGPAGHLLVRAIFGGSVDDGIDALERDALLSVARAEVGRLYGIDEDPVFSEAVRWPHAIPQYELGHGERVVRIDRAIGALPNVWITGNGLRGVSFADAAGDGVRTGEALARQTRKGESTRAN